MTNNIEQLAERVSVADISSAIAFGLQRALERKEISSAIGDKIVRFGGILHFQIEVAPAVNPGSISATQVLK